MASAATSRVDDEYARCFRAGGWAWPGLGNKQDCLVAADGCLDLGLAGDMAAIYLQ